jgi:hypothetical protein
MKKELLKTPTDRSFGFTFAVVFGLLGTWLVWHSSAYGWPAFGVGAAFAVVALTIPRVLHPLNVVWMRFALLLNKIVSPIVLGVIFFGIFMPVSLIFRAIRRDALRRKFDSALTSYWIDREPPGPPGTSFPRQF